jgi:hypothetical protein
VRHRSRLPLLIAFALAVAAVLLLWFRMPRPAATQAGPTAQRPAPPSAPAAPEAAPRSSAPPTPPLEQPPSPEDGAFVVRVVDGNGPVAGARVRAWRGVPEDVTGLPGWRRAGEGTTAADGTLRLPAAPGDYLLSALAPGHAPARREVTRPTGEAETAVELALPAGVSLQGRTVAEGRAGEPVPLAEVTLRPYPGVPTPWTRPADLPEESSVAMSDAQGRFGFSGLAPGRYALTADAPGFSRRTLRFLHVPREGELVVGLWGAGTLEGFVVDAKGQPVSGAEVTASGGLAPMRATTGESGGFALEVQAGTWVLSARHRQALGALPAPLSVAPGETLRGLTVTLGAAGGLEGHVVSADGAPVPGAMLVASVSGSDGALGRATSGEDGGYRLELPPGQYDVAVGARGFASSTREGLVVPPGAWAPLEVRLEPASAEVEGLVVDAAGRPVQGAEVRAQPREGGGEAHTTRSDARGAYLLQGLEPGVTVVRARQGTATGWTSRLEPLKAGARAQVDFTLQGTGIVQGQVTRASGGPPSEPALVRARARGTGSSLDLATVETDAQGRYQLEVPAGVYQLTAVLPGARFMYFHEDDPAVTVPEGSAVQQDLMLGDERGVHGTVLEPSGAPSPHAAVAAVQDGDFPLTVRVRADEDGTFALPTRPAGAPPLKEVVAHQAGRVGRVASVSEDGSGLSLRLQPAATLRGRVVARGGAAPEGFALSLSEPDGGELPWAPLYPPARHFPGDVFVLHDAPGQPLKLTVRTTDGRTGEAQVTLSPGGTADVEVPLTGGASSITGHAVWSRGGGPAAGVAVFLDKSVSSRPDAVTGADGRFRLDDVNPGHHTVRLQPPEGRVETRTVKVEPAQAADLGEVAVSPRRASPGTLGAGFSEDRGYVSIAWLTPDGPAARAGVAVGDRLLAVDGRGVRDRTEAEARTRGAPGSPVRLQVRRAGSEQEVLVTRAP